MHEILFRGKTDKDKWVYGAYCHYDDVIDSGKDDCDYIIEKHNGESFPFVKVVRKTIGQFTGLTDANGTKIFEGDIVDHKDEYGQIIYSEEDAAFQLKGDGWTADLGNFFSCEIEVIGNIHDNPELLEKE